MEASIRRTPAYTMLDADFKERLKELAKDSHQSLSTFIEQTLKNAIGKTSEWEADEQTWADVRQAEKEYREGTTLTFGTAEEIENYFSKS